MREIFVFGSNLAGIHGAGAALFARKHHGALQRVGVGLQGSSYAIPTKDEHIRTLPLSVIEKHVKDFIAFANQHHEMAFNVTRIGCGLAGYKDQDIAPMFRGAPVNCRLPDEWRNIIYDASNPTFHEALDATKQSLGRLKEFLAQPIE